MHFKSVDEVVRCLVEDRGVSDRGILGIPYSHRCDCTDYHSEQADWRRERIRKEQQRMDEAVQAIVDEVKRQSVFGSESGERRDSSAG
jgi:hypothetical protein